MVKRDGDKRRRCYLRRRKKATPPNKVPKTHVFCSKCNVYLYANGRRQNLDTQKHTNKIQTICYVFNSFCLDFFCEAKFALLPNGKEIVFMNIIWKKNKTSTIGSLLRDKFWHQMKGYRLHFFSSCNKICSSSLEEEKIRMNLADENVYRRSHKKS